MTIFTIAGLIVALLAALFFLMRRSRIVVPQDHSAVVVDHKGFIKRTLPGGIHWLWPGRERIEFILPTKPALCRAIVETVPSADGIPLRISWSGPYRRDPALITDRISERLRSLPNAGRSIERHTNIALYRLVGAYTMAELFKPAIRERIERRLSETVADHMKPKGVIVYGLSLEGVELPPEVAGALNQARAIEALDSAIRRSDAATREVMIGAHRLEKWLAWAHYLPNQSRFALAPGSMELQLPTSKN